MKTLALTLLASVALATTAGCSTTPHPDFRTEAAPDAPLASYQTYAWASEKAGTGANPLRYEQVRTAMETSLAAAGFRKVAVDQADMILGFTLGARDKVDVTDWGPVAPYYPAYGRAYRYGWAYNYNSVDVRTVTEGSMALDVFDGKTDRPVWHGIASGRIGSQGVSNEMIQAAVDGLVQRFVMARG